MEILLGAVVALLTQWLKQHTANQWQTIGVCLLLSFVAAFMYTYLVSVGYWATFLTVIATAQTIYSLIIARFE